MCAGMSFQDRFSEKGRRIYNVLFCVIVKKKGDVCVYFYAHQLSVRKHMRSLLALGRGTVGQVTGIFTLFLFYTIKKNVLTGCMWNPLKKVSK